MSRESTPRTKSRSRTPRSPTVITPRAEVYAHIKMLIESNNINELEAYLKKHPLIWGDVVRSEIARPRRTIEPRFTDVITGQDTLGVNDVHISNNPLHVAVYNNNEDAVSVLLESGCPVHYEYEKDSQLYISPITIAIQNGSYPIVEQLLQAGVDLTYEKSPIAPYDAIYPHGWPLLEAIKQRDNKMIELLLASNQHNHMNSATNLNEQLLFKAKMTSTPLYTAFVAGGFDYVKELAEKYAFPLEQTSIQGLNCIMELCQHWVDEPLQALLSETQYIDTQSQLWLYQKQQLLTYLLHNLQNSPSHSRSFDAYTISSIVKGPLRLNSRSDPSLSILRMDSGRLDCFTPTPSSTWKTSAAHLLMYSLLPYLQSASDTFLSETTRVTLIPLEIAQTHLKTVINTMTPYHAMLFAILARRYDIFFHLLANITPNEIPNIITSFSLALIAKTGWVRALKILFSTLDREYIISIAFTEVSSVNTPSTSVDNNAEASAGPQSVSFSLSNSTAAQSITHRIHFLDLSLPSTTSNTWKLLREACIKYKFLPRDVDPSYATSAIPVQYIYAHNTHVADYRTSASEQTATEPAADSSPANLLDARAKLYSIKGNLASGRPDPLNYLPPFLTTPEVRAKVGSFELVTQIHEYLSAELRKFKDVTPSANSTPKTTPKTTGRRLSADSRQSFRRNSSVETMSTTSHAPSGVSTGPPMLSKQESVSNMNFFLQHQHHQKLQQLSQHAESQHRFKSVALDIFFYALSIGDWHTVMLYLRDCALTSNKGEIFMIHPSIFEPIAFLPKLPVVYHEVIDIASLSTFFGLLFCDTLGDVPVWFGKILQTDALYFLLIGEANEDFDTMIPASSAAPQGALSMFTSTTTKSQSDVGQATTTAHASNAFSYVPAVNYEPAVPASVYNGNIPADQLSTADDDSTHGPSDEPSRASQVSTTRNSNSPHTGRSSIFTRNKRIGARVNPTLLFGHQYQYHEYLDRWFQYSPHSGLLRYITKFTGLIHESAVYSRYHQYTTAYKLTRYFVDAHRQSFIISHVLATLNPDMLYRTMALLVQQNQIVHQQYRLASSSESPSESTLNTSTLSTCNPALLAPIAINALSNSPFLYQFLASLIPLRIQQSVFAHNVSSNYYPFIKSIQGYANPVYIYTSHGQQYAFATKTSGMLRRAHKLLSHFEHIHSTGYDHNNDHAQRTVSYTGRAFDLPLHQLAYVFADDELSQTVLALGFVQGADSVKGLIVKQTAHSQVAVEMAPEVSNNDQAEVVTEDTPSPTEEDTPAVRAKDNADDQLPSIDVEPVAIDAEVAIASEESATAVVDVEPIDTTATQQDDSPAEDAPALDETETKSVEASMSKVEESSTPEEQPSDEEKDLNDDVISSPEVEETAATVENEPVESQDPSEELTTPSEDENGNLAASTEKEPSKTSSDVEQEATEPVDEDAATTNDADTDAVDVPEPQPEADQTSSETQKDQEEDGEQESNPTIAAAISAIDADQLPGADDDIDVEEPQSTERASAGDKSEASGDDHVTSAFTESTSGEQVAPVPLPTSASSPAAVSGVGATQKPGSDSSGSIQSSQIPSGATISGGLRRQSAATLSIMGSSSRVSMLIDEDMDDMFFSNIRHSTSPKSTSNSSTPSNKSDASPTSKHSAYRFPRLDSTKHQHASLAIDDEAAPALEFPPGTTSGEQTVSSATPTTSSFASSLLASVDSRLGSAEGVEKLHAQLLAPYKSANTNTVDTVYSHLVSITSTLLPNQFSVKQHTQFPQLALVRSVALLFKLKSPASVHTRGYNPLFAAKYPSLNRSLCLLDVSLRHQLSFAYHELLNKNISVAGIYKTSKSTDISTIQQHTDHFAKVYYKYLYRHTSLSILTHENTKTELKQLEKDVKSGKVQALTTHGEGKTQSIGVATSAAAQKKYIKDLIDSCSKVSKELDEARKLIKKLYEKSYQHSIDVLDDDEVANITYDASQLRLLEKHDKKTETTFFRKFSTSIMGNSNKKNTGITAESISSAGAITRRGTVAATASGPTSGDDEDAANPFANLQRASQVGHVRSSLAIHNNVVGGANNTSSGRSTDGDATGENQLPSYESLALSPIRYVDNKTMNPFTLIDAHDFPIDPAVGKPEVHSLRIVRTMNILLVNLRDYLSTSTTKLNLLLPIHFKHVVLSLLLQMEDVAFASRVYKAILDFAKADLACDRKNLPILSLDDCQYLSSYKFGSTPEATEYDASLGDLQSLSNGDVNDMIFSRSNIPLLNRIAAYHVYSYHEKQLGDSTTSPAPALLTAFDRCNKAADKKQPVPSQPPLSLCPGLSLSNVIGNTPLTSLPLHAVGHIAANPDLLYLLLDSGLDIHYTNDQGISFLTLCIQYYATIRSTIGAHARKMQERVKGLICNLILDRQVSLFTTNLALHSASSTPTPLHWLLFYKCVDIIEYLTMINPAVLVPPHEAASYSPEAVNPLIITPYTGYGSQYHSSHQPLSGSKLKTFVSPLLLPIVAEDAAQWIKSTPITYPTIDSALDDITAWGYMMLYSAANSDAVLLSALRRTEVISTLQRTDSTVLPITDVGQTASVSATSNLVVQEDGQSATPSAQIVLNTLQHYQAKANRHAKSVEAWLRNHAFVPRISRIVADNAHADASVAEPVHLTFIPLTWAWSSFSTTYLPHCSHQIVLTPFSASVQKGIQQETTYFNVCYYSTDYFDMNVWREWRKLQTSLAAKKSQPQSSPSASSPKSTTTNSTTPKAEDEHKTNDDLL